MNQQSSASFQLPFLTAALRSWMVNKLLRPQDLSEISYLLLELGYQELPADDQMADFLKLEMSRLSSGGMPEQMRLIRLCEGIIQFYLLEHPDETPELSQLNQFLPPGVSFSLVTGRLLFEPENYYQPHNLFVQEQAHWYLKQEESQELLAALAQQPTETEPDTLRPTAHELIEKAETASGPSERRLQFKEIRERRLQLLRKWEEKHV